LKAGHPLDKLRQLLQIELTVTIIVKPREEHPGTWPAAELCSAGLKTRSATNAFCETALRPAVLPSFAGAAGTAPSCWGAIARPGSACRAPLVLLFGVNMFAAVPVRFLQPGGTISAIRFTPGAIGFLSEQGIGADERQRQHPCCP
jgi:hypothetical protein